jgi:pyruvate dehydrogenase phosphatase
MLYEKILRAAKILLQGIAKRLVRAAVQEAARKREMRYEDIKRIEKGVRRYFHDDITVIVLYLDQSRGSPNGRLNGTTSVPVDIFSLNADVDADDAEVSLHAGS